jgi:ubiquinone/menaquinone biosynthesis C-methylase UbiE
MVGGRCPRTGGGRMTLRPETISARRRVRTLMPVEGDLAFRRRCETILEWLDPAPGQRVLDCGCGYGFTLQVLAELTESQLVGLAADSDRVEQTRRDLAGSPRVTVVHGDARALPFADAAFDHAVCSEVLEHVPDAAAVVRELGRVVRPGGRLVITVPSAAFPVTWDPPNWILKRLGGAQLRGERPWSGIWYGHRRLYDWEQLGTLLAGAGFELEERRPLTFRSPPFAHLLLYGIGKPLLQHGWFPGSLRRRAGRMPGNAASPGILARSVMWVLEAIDAPNDDPARVARASEFVALAVVARRTIQAERIDVGGQVDLSIAATRRG